MLKIKHGGRTSAVQRSARRTRGRYAPINVNPAGGSAGKGTGFDNKNDPLCRAFDFGSRPGGWDI